jgi:hypothetical protein
MQGELWNDKGKSMQIDEITTETISGNRCSNVINKYWSNKETKVLIKTINPQLKHKMLLLQLQ